MNKTLAASLAAALATFTACGDNDDGHDHEHDGAVEIDAANIDAAIDAGIDAPTDAPAVFVPPTPFAVPLSAAGPDQLQSAAAGPGGTFYAAGYAAATVSGARLVTVVQMSTTGPVTTFGGGDGVATTALDFKGGSDEVDLVVQSTGKILVSATVANATDPLDRDLAVTRLNADGTLDTTFGVDGVRILDLSTAHNNGTSLVGLDASRGLAVGAGDIIYVHGASRATGNTSGGTPRTDTDFTVVKLDADGTRDLTFGGGDGAFTLDIQESGATARGIQALPDGSIIAGGYANSSGLGSTQIVMYKLTAAGELVSSFGTGGLFHEVVLAVQTETYNFAIHGNNIVTAGYGRDSGDQNDWISLRFDATTGVRDLTWGAPSFTGGRVLIDPSGTMVGDNCRNAVVLPNGKTALIGSTAPSSSTAQDAAVAILTAGGELDTAYGDGVHTFPLGANGNDQFWGGAVSGSNLLLVGYKGASTQTDTVNDDAYGVILPLQE